MKATVASGTAVFVTLAVACGQLLGIDETRDQSTTASGMPGSGKNSSGGENQVSASGGLKGSDEAGQANSPDEGSRSGAGGEGGTSDPMANNGGGADTVPAGGKCSTCGGALEAGAAGAAGADWSPRDMPSLLLWLDAGNDVLVNGSAVVAWTAQSTLAPAASQAEATHRPTWQPNVFGPLPGVIFDGVDDVLVMSDTDARFAAQIGTGDFVMSVAFSATQHHAASPEGMVLGKQEPQQWPFLGLAVFSTQPPMVATGGYQAQLDLASQRVWTSPLDGVDYDSGKVHVLSMLRSSPELMLRIDGREVDHANSQPAIDIRQPGIDFSIGAHWQGTESETTQHFAGAVGEIVIGGASSLAVFEQLEDYLVRKYRPK